MYGCPHTLSHTHKLTWSTRSARTPVGACVAHVAKARGQADAFSKCIGVRGARQAARVRGSTGIVIVLACGT